MASRRIARVVFQIAGLVTFPSICFSQESAAGGRGLEYHVNVVSWDEIGIHDINNAGQAAMSLSGFSPGVHQAFLFDPRDGFIELGAGPNTRAFAINRKAEIAGNQVGPGLPLAAFRWSESKGSEFVPAEDALHTWASDISDDGSIVGWLDREEHSELDPAIGVRVRRAFIWTESGVRSLEDLPGGEISSSAHAISPNGRIVVGHSYVDGGSHAFWWREGQGMHDIGELLGGHIEAAAFSVNDRGTIVGYSLTEGDGNDRNGDGEQDSLHQAFIWTEDSGMKSLGQLQAGHGTIAYDINRAGVVVGRSDPLGFGKLKDFLPFIWTEDGGMRDLHTLLDEESKAWRLSGALMRAINDHGDIAIAGYLGDRWASLILTPNTHSAPFVLPEPSVGLAGLGIFALMHRRGRRH